jgi:hypothetical protein
VQGDFYYEHNLFANLHNLITACILLSLSVKILLPIFRPAPATPKTDGELPAEYVSSSLAQQSQV